MGRTNEGVGRVDDCVVSLTHDVWGFTHSRD